MTSLMVLFIWLIKRQPRGGRAVELAPRRSHLSPGQVPQRCAQPGARPAGGPRGRRQERFSHGRARALPVSWLGACLPQKVSLSGAESVA